MEICWPRIWNSRKGNFMFSYALPIVTSNNYNSECTILCYETLANSAIAFLVVHAPSYVMDMCCSTTFLLYYLYLFLFLIPFANSTFALLCAED
jgi:hypothetical protein